MTFLNLSFHFKLQTTGTVAEIFSVAVFHPVILVVLNLINIYLINI